MALTECTYVGQERFTSDEARGVAESVASLNQVCTTYLHRKGGVRFDRPNR